MKNLLTVLVVLLVALGCAEQSPDGEQRDGLVRLKEGIETMPGILTVERIEIVDDLLVIDVVSSQSHSDVLPNVVEDTFASVAVGMPDALDRMYDVSVTAYTSNNTHMLSNWMTVAEQEDLRMTVEAIERGE